MLTDLLIFHDWTYIPITVLGLLCYWLNVFDNESERCRERGIPFYVLNYIDRQKYFIPLTSILIIVTNVFWVEYINDKHGRAMMMFELFTLAWGGGSLLRMAMKMFQRLVKNAILKYGGK